MNWPWVKDDKELQALETEKNAKRLSLEHWRATLFNSDISSQYVLEDLLYNILGYGERIDDDEGRIRMNVANEILGRLGVSNIEQRVNFTLAIKSMPVTKEVL